MITMQCIAQLYNLQINFKVTSNFVAIYHYAKVSSEIETSSLTTPLNPSRYRIHFFLLLMFSIQLFNHTIGIQWPLSKDFPNKHFKSVLLQYFFLYKIRGNEVSRPLVNILNPMIQSTQWFVSINVLYLFMIFIITKLHFIINIKLYNFFKNSTKKKSADQSLNRWKCLPVNFYTSFFNLFSLSL